MEQIRIRQPKMPAAQSFIQISGTLLAILFNFIDSNISLINKNLSILKRGKSIGSTGFSLKKPNFIDQRNKFLEVMKL